MKYIFYIVCSILHFKHVKVQELYFSDDFMFGVATSAYQIEGSWNIKGKAENMWDRFTHTHPEAIDDGLNGDVACDSYNKLKVDLEMLQWLGVNHYRFSISWSRLLPTGFANKINEDSVRYYNELIDGLLARNITPLVTLYHWDLPQILSDLGGWTNLQMSHYFADYARVVFSSFGDRVKRWITINEPYQICQKGYGFGIMAPGLKIDGIANYLCGRTILLAHAKAYRLYDKEFRDTQNGMVGFTADAYWYEPATNSSEDLEAAEIAMQFYIGWWFHPIFSKTGDYPPIMKKRIRTVSMKEKYPQSRLIPFNNDEIHLIQGTYDFMGLNYYTSMMASANVTNVTWNSPSYERDQNVNTYYHQDWKVYGADYIYDVPWGLRKLLNWIKNEYNNPEIYITENGVVDIKEQPDLNRINFIKGHLQSLLEAIHIDNCTVKAYIYWSLMDNMEWNHGYTKPFGLFNVDFNSTNRTRTRKESAPYYKCVIQNRTPNCIIP